MPLPRYQPPIKRLKAMDAANVGAAATSNIADDRCLAKIIGNALSQSCLRLSNGARDEHPTNARENNINNNNNNNTSFDGGYSTLVRSKLASGAKTVYQIETNDSTLIEHLVKSADKICPSHVLESFKLSTQVRSFDLFAKLMRSKNLGASLLQLSLEMATFELLRDVKIAVETFRKSRGSSATCQLSLFVKDQKIPECEEKINNLVHICRQADVKVHVSALQRVSIDCCHLMWSTGRALQGSDGGGATNTKTDKHCKCLFKITLKTYPLKQSQTNPSEITIPLGNNSDEPAPDSKREDLARYREILRSLKRDCYNQFVKSVRENNTPVQ